MSNYPVTTCHVSSVSWTPCLYPRVTCQDTLYPRVNCQDTLYRVYTYSRDLENGLCDRHKKAEIVRLSEFQRQEAGSASLEDSYRGTVTLTTSRDTASYMYSISGNLCNPLLYSPP